MIAFVIFCICLYFVGFLLFFLYIEECHQRDRKKKPVPVVKEIESDRAVKKISSSPDVWQVVGHSGRVELETQYEEFARLVKAELDRLDPVPLPVIRQLGLKVEELDAAFRLSDSLESQKEKFHNLAKFPPAVVVPVETNAGYKSSTLYFCYDCNTNYPAGYKKHRYHDTEPASLQVGWTLPPL
jgi:hypothetical protein